MDRAAYRLIWSCLHDDSRKSVSSEKLNKAFNIWTEAKAKVLGEEENPTSKFMGGHPAHCGRVASIISGGGEATMEELDEAVTASHP
jgi:hypothetical protein